MTDVTPCHVSVSRVTGFPGPQEESSDETVRPTRPERRGRVGNTWFRTALLVGVARTLQAPFIFPVWAGVVSVTVLVRRRSLRPAWAVRSRVSISGNLAEQNGYPDRCDDGRVLLRLGSTSTE